MRVDTIRADFRKGMLALCRRLADTRGMPPDRDAAARANRAAIALRRLDIGARVRHVNGPPRVYLVIGYTDGFKVKVEAEGDQTLRGAFAPDNLVRVPSGG
jgi:hypothetical protein